MKKPLWNEEKLIKKLINNQVEILKIWETILEPYQRDGRKIVFVMTNCGPLNSGVNEGKIQVEQVISKEEIYNLVMG